MSRCGRGLDGVGPTGDVPDRALGVAVHVRPAAARDERWQDPWNQGVNAESFLYDPQMPAQAKSLMMLYKRLRRDRRAGDDGEHHSTRRRAKPWGYYLDMSRQLWDEARHAMMGEVGFAALGVDWTHARITLNWSYEAQHRIARRSNATRCSTSSSRA